MDLKLKHLKAGIRTVTAIARNKITGYRAPLLAYILVTNRCNLDCVYCFSNAHRTSPMDLSSEQLFSIIDQLKQCGTLMITVSGGEPCLRNDLGEIIEYILQKGMLVELVTNGIRFEKNIDIIRKVDFLAISVDGSEEAHDKNRGKGSFKVAMKALELACQHGIHTRIHASFSKYNAHSLPDLMEICKKFGVRANIAVPSIHASDPSLSFGDDEIKAYYRQMKEYKEKGYLISNAAATLNYIINWPGHFGYIAEKPEPGLPYLPCKRKDFSVYINADGCAYPCCAVWGKYNFNVLEKGVCEVFDNFKKIPCNTCIGEAEFHLLFQGNISSIINVAAFGLTDRIRKLAR